MSKPRHCVHNMCGADLRWSILHLRFDVRPQLKSVKHVAQLSGGSTCNSRHILHLVPCAGVLSDFLCRFLWKTVVVDGVRDIQLEFSPRAGTATARHDLGAYGTATADGGASGGWTVYGHHHGGADQPVGRVANEAASRGATGR